jgi:hypothetical protein
MNHSMTKMHIIVERIRGTMVIYLMMLQANTLSVMIMRNFIRMS